MGRQVTCWVLTENDEWLAIDQRQIDLGGQVFVDLGGQVFIDLGGQVFVDLAVCSVVPHSRCEATITDVHVHPLV